MYLYIEGEMIKLVDFRFYYSMHTFYNEILLQIACLNIVLKAYFTSI